MSTSLDRLTSMLRVMLCSQTYARSRRCIYDSSRSQTEPVHQDALERSCTTISRGLCA